MNFFKGTTMLKGILFGGMLAVASSHAITLEAENASYRNGSVKSNADASGGKYVDLNGGGNVTWTYNASVAGNVNLSFTVKSPSGTRIMGVYVNNSKVGVISHNTNSWTSKSIASLGVSVNSGNNTIEFRDSEGKAEFDVDKLDVTPNTHGTSGWFNDSRDGKIYKWVVIGNQKWFANNLSYEIPGQSKCIDNGTDCDSKLYTWFSATADNHGNGKDVCPVGWHMPTWQEWTTLGQFVHGDPEKLMTGGMNGSNLYGLSIIGTGYIYEGVSYSYQNNSWAEYFSSNLDQWGDVETSYFYSTPMSYIGTDFYSPESDLAEFYNPVRCIED